MTLAEKKIIRLLDESGCVYELFTHEPVYTCEQAAKVRGVTLDKGIKCLILRAEGKFILAIGRGHKKIDLKKLAKIVGVKKLELANARDVTKIAQCPVGCVHPFCEIEKYIDRFFMNDDVIEFNPGCHDKTIRMKVPDLLKTLGESTIVDFSM